MLNYAEKYSTATTLKKILMNLSGLDAEQRNDKIAEYNNLIAEIGEEKIKDKIFSYVLTAAGFIPVIGNITSCIEQIIRSYGDLGLKRKHSIKKIEAGIATKDDEVYILDKLSRVAKISID